MWGGLGSENSVRIHGISDDAQLQLIRERLLSGISAYRCSIPGRLWARLSPSEEIPIEDEMHLFRAQVDGPTAAIVTFSSNQTKRVALRGVKDYLPAMDDHFRGITTLYSTSNADLDICAIHGLNGNALDTWTAEKKVWLRDLLPLSAPFNKCRIMTYGYNSSITDRSATAGVRQWAIEFLHLIDQQRARPEERERPLIIVCHSLGGLVGREALIRLGSFSNDYANISLHQCGALFLGTPHSGSVEADWNDILLSITEYAFGVRSNDLVSNLQSFNDGSVASKEQFAALKPIPAYCCLSEGRKTKILGTYKWVVPQDSAGLLGMTAVSLTDVDHKGLCKFDFESAAYLLVRWKLMLLREAVLQNQSAQVEEQAYSQTQYREPQTPKRRRTGDVDSAIHGGSKTTFGTVTSHGQSTVKQVGSVNATNVTL